MRECNGQFFLFMENAEIARLKVLLTKFSVGLILKNPPNLAQIQSQIKFQIQIKDLKFKFPTLFQVLVLIFFFFKI